jgi:DNA polymerase-3 subunit epsilon
MRQIVLDTETTGLEAQHGHRIIEIGCVELLHRRLTRKTFHRYINPERPVDEGAVEVHGLTDDFLADKPRYADIVAEFVDFIRGADEIVIHNAPFDVGFLDAEFQRLDGAWGRIEDYCEVRDSLRLARSLHPGQRNSLDALCRRYEIDNSGRELHGALLDAELLADVYLAMTGGQASLGLDAEAASSEAGIVAPARAVRRGPIPVIRASEDEIAAHETRLRDIAEDGGRCLWLQADAEY